MDMLWALMWGWLSSAQREIVLGLAAMDLLWTAMGMLWALAGQSRAGQGRAGQGRAGQDRAGQGRAGQGRAGRSGQGKAHFRS